MQTGPIHVTSADRATATHADAVVTYAAVPGRTHVVSAIQFSFSAPPTVVAYLKVEDGAGNVVKKVAVTAAGPGPVEFSVLGTPGNAMIVTLTDGGSAIIGDLNCDHFLN